ncbi:MAG: hypothetical protein WB392_07735 [Methanotrichaceae archaeon]
MDEKAFLYSSLKGTRLKTSEDLMELESQKGMAQIYAFDISSE